MASAAAYHKDATTVSKSFGFRLYNSLRSDCSIDGNIFFSPINITIGLAITYMGAKGETAKQMERLLKVPSQSEDFHMALKDILHSGLFVNDQSIPYQLNMANRLYGQQNFKYESEYLTSTRDFVRRPVRSSRFCTWHWVRQKSRKCLDRTDPNKNQAVICSRFVVR